MRSCRANTKLVLVLALAIAGCQAKGTVTTPKPPLASAKATAAITDPTPTPATVASAGAGLVVPAIPPGASLRTIAQTGAATQLTGKVKLLTDNGGGVISDHGIGIVSNNGGGILSENGSGIISEHGGGLTSKTKFLHLLDAATPPTAEAYLAEAQVELVDATGRLLVDEQGKPLAGTTDLTGAYTLKAVLPPGNLYARVRLGVNPATTGAQLLALVTQGAGAAAAVDINTQTSFGATYVQQAYVKNLDANLQQPRFDLLKPADAIALAASVSGALAAAGTLPTAPTYLPEDQVKATDVLRGATKDLDNELITIHNILFIGQSDAGNGLAATLVPFSEPAAFTGDGKGSYFVAELTASRIRKIGADGKVSLYAGLGKIGDAAETTNVHDGVLGPPTDLQLAPDGSLVVVEGTANQVRRLTPDGAAHVLIGASTATGGAALTTPSCVAVAADGTLYVGDRPLLDARVLQCKPDGTVSVIATPEAFWKGTRVDGLAAAADGGLYAVLSNGLMAHRPAAAAAWVQLAVGTPDEGYARVVADPAGGCWVSQPYGHRLLHLTDTGTVTTVAGTGVPGDAGDDGPASAATLTRPAGLWLSANRLFVTDLANGRVRVIDLAATPPTIKNFAGSQGVTQVGGTTTLALNQPAGLLYDTEGHLIFTEAASGTVKKLVGHGIQLVAGSSVGYAGDGGPATAAQLNGPSGTASDGKNIYVVDAGNHRVRRIAADGTISAVAGAPLVGPAPVITSARLPAAQMPIGRVLGIAIGPDGQPWWVDDAYDLVERLDPSGDVVVVAGSLPARVDVSVVSGGDGGPATSAVLNHPFGIAFDSKGTCYVSEAFNTRVRAIDASGKISTLVGKSLLETVQTPDATGAVAVPGALAVDKDDNLYVTDMGTIHLDLFSLITGGGGSNKLGGGFPLPRVPGRIRRISTRNPGAGFTTIAGPGGKLLPDPFADGALLLPFGIAIAPDGTLAVSDAGDDEIKLLPAP